MRPPFDMKKTLLCMALAAGLVPAAFAQGNVQLYGVIDAGVTHFSGIKGGTGSTSATGLSSGVQGGDRIGIRGGEDLGGGLKAVFDVETGFCGTGISQNQPVGYAGAGAANGYCTGGPSGGFMQRQSWVGLKGSFGEIMGGRLYTTQFLNEAAIDPFGYGLTGNIGNLALAVPRSQQTIEFVAPTIGGFTGNATYTFAANNGNVPGATPATSKVGRGFSLDGMYDQGPVVAGLLYSQSTNTVVNPATGLNDGKTSLWQAFGSYDFGSAKVAALYEHLAGDYNTPTQKFYMLGVTVPAGPGALLASYGHLDNGLANGVAKQYAIGYKYNLSKQTDLYASYSHMTNGLGVSKAVGDSTDVLAGVAGVSSSGVTVGMSHSF